MREHDDNLPTGYSYIATGRRFLAGAAVTAIFSGSLAVLTKKVGLTEVLITGMIVPSFTWMVQLSAALIGLPKTQRRYYCGDLGRVCVIGSVALLPAAYANLSLPSPAGWRSVVNVLLSVTLMGLSLFRLSARHEIDPRWSAGWCLTICVNMGLFLWASWHWW